MIINSNKTKYVKVEKEGDAQKQVIPSPTWEQGMQEERIVHILILIWNRESGYQLKNNPVTNTH